MQVEGFLYHILIRDATAPFIATPAYEIVYEIRKEKDVFSAKERDYNTASFLQKTKFWCNKQYIEQRKDPKPGLASIQDHH